MDNFDRIKNKDTDYKWKEGRGLDWFAWFVFAIMAIFVLGFWVGWWSF